MVRERTVKRVFFLLFLFLVLLLGACNQAPPPAIDSENGIEAVLLTDPDPPALMQETVLKITLFDHTRQEIAGAKLSLDLTMPGMEMPPNQPAVTEVDSGLYEARTILTMAGPWDVLLTVQYAGKTDYFNFPLEVK